MNNHLALCMLAASLIAFLPVGAAYVNVLSPYNYTVYNNSTIQLGNVGPGQTFYVTISSQTTNDTGFLFNLGWNKLVATDLPNGWIVQNSSLNNQVLSTEISVAPRAANGSYSFNLTAINIGNYSRLGSVKFKVNVNVTPNVFQLSTTPKVVNSQVGKPATVQVIINNTGVSDSPFRISIIGLPGWNSTSTVIALHHTTGTFSYPIYENESGVYHISLYVNSTASPLINKASNLTLAVQATLPSDYSAIGEGSPLFPIVYEPAYAIMYLIGLLYKML